MNLYQNQLLLSVYLFAFLISLLFIILWASFFFFYSPKKTTPKRYLIISFIFGVIAAFLALLIERFFLSCFGIDLSFLQSFFVVRTLQGLITPFVFSFFFIALIEESIKFIFLKKYLKVNIVNQVIDGMKIGLWLGLGFAFIENTLYFINFNYQMADYQLFVQAVFVRGIFSTLAHAIYGIIMGYYLSLAKFHKMFQSHLVKVGFIAPLVAHGFFNFFLIVNLGIYSAFILIFLLIFVLFWYNARKNLELYLPFKIKRLTSPPFLTGRMELEVLLSKQKASAEAFRRILDLFPPQKSKK